jgi:hypothetical protein
MAPTPPLHLLTKRDNMGFALHPSLIVLLVLLGAGFMVAAGYAINSAFGFREDGNGFKATSPEQMQYMADVRARNMDKMMSEGQRAWARGEESSRRTGDVVYN